MNILRQESIGKYRVTIEKFDEYNDYSVAYQHYVTVTHADGGFSCWECGRSERQAHEAFNRACTTIKHHTVAPVFGFRPI